MQSNAIEEKEPEKKLFLFKRSFWSLFFKFYDEYEN